MIDKKLTCILIVNHIIKQRIVQYKRETEGGRTFAARTIKKWNAIDTSIRALESVNSFK